MQFQYDHSLGPESKASTLRRSPVHICFVHSHVLLLFHADLRLLQEVWYQGLLTERTSSAAARHQRVLSGSYYTSSYVSVVPGTIKFLLVVTHEDMVLLVTIHSMGLLVTKCFIILKSPMHVVKKAMNNSGTLTKPMLP